MLDFKCFEINKSINFINEVKDLYTSSCLNIKLLISATYGVGAGVKEYKDYFHTDQIIKFLKKQQAELIEVVETKSLTRHSEEENDSFNDSDKHYIFRYKDNFIRVDINDEVSLNSKEKEKSRLTFYYPINKKCIDDEFTKFLIHNNEPSVFILNQEYGDFTFSKFNVSLPKNIDIDLNYGKGFSKTNKLIIESINNNFSGLYMFHGPPGTGKSTYIKYLSTIVKKDVIFFPTSMVSSLTDPNIINLLIRKQNCVLILEDAEKAIVKRESNSEASLVSTLLNMTDGILGDVLKLNIIVTYNCDRNDIDEALLRRGRLKAEHSFKLLTKDQAKVLVEALKLDVDVIEDMSLADIYNFKREEELIGNRKDLNKQRVIGFK